MSDSKLRPGKVELMQAHSTNVTIVSFYTYVPTKPVIISTETSLTTMILIVNSLY